MTASKLKSFTAALVVGATVVVAGATTASAVTIGIYNDSNGATRASVDCTGCSALLYTKDATDAGGVGGANNVVEGTIPGDHGFGTGFGELFTNGFGVNPTDEVAWINSVLGTTYVLGNHAKTNGTTDGTLYTSSADYVIVKVGRDPNYTILRNDGGGIDFKWYGASGGGAGISHFSEIGVAPIPVPAAGFLLAGALGGLAALRRRRKTA